MDLFADQYKGAINASGLTGVLAAKEALNPTAVEDIVLGLARSTSAEYVSLAASWSALQERIGGGESLSFEKAFALHSEFAYAERVISPAVAAGQVVEAARAAESGWQDAGVQEMIDDLAQRTSCNDPEEGLREVLAETGTAGLDGMLMLDSEMRAALPAYGLANDAIIVRGGGRR